MKNVPGLKKIYSSLVLAFFVIFSTSLIASGDASAAKSSSAHASSIWGFLLDAAVFGLAGILLLIVGYYIWEAITLSYSVKKELIEKQNQAVATVTASFIIGMAIIIAAALILIK